MCLLKQVYSRREGSTSTKLLHAIWIWPTQMHWNEVCSLGSQIGSNWDIKEVHYHQSTWNSGTCEGVFNYPPPPHTQSHLGVHQLQWKNNGSELKYPFPHGLCTLHLLGIWKWWPYRLHFHSSKYTLAHSWCCACVRGVTSVAASRSNWTVIVCHDNKWVVAEIRLLWCWWIDRHYTPVRG